MPLLHTIMLFALAGQLYFFSHKTFVYYTPEVTFKTPFMASSETIEGTSSLLFLEIFGHKVENKIRPTAKTEMEKSEFGRNTVRREIKDSDKIITSSEQLMCNGEAFELIDGDNLEFKGLLIKEVVR